MNTNRPSHFSRSMLSATHLNLTCSSMTHGTIYLKKGKIMSEGCLGRILCYIITILFLFRPAYTCRRSIYIKMLRKR